MESVPAHPAGVHVCDALHVSSMGCAGSACGGAVEQVHSSVIGSTSVWPRSGVTTALLVTENEPVDRDATAVIVSAPDTLSSTVSTIDCGHDAPAASDAMDITGELPPVVLTTIWSTASGTGRSEYTTTMTRVAGEQAAIAAIAQSTDARRSDLHITPR
jgi:hypothetical protein